MVPFDKKNTFVVHDDEYLSTLSREMMSSFNTGGILHFPGFELLIQSPTAQNTEVIKHIFPFPMQKCSYCKVDAQRKLCEHFYLRVGIICKKKNFF